MWSLKSGLYWGWGCRGGCKGKQVCLGCQWEPYKISKKGGNRELSQGANNACVEGKDPLGGHRGWVISEARKSLQGPPYVRNLFGSR